MAETPQTKPRGKATKGKQDKQLKKILAALLKKGKAEGFVTQDEILRMVPFPEEHLEMFFTQLLYTTT